MVSRWVTRVLAAILCLAVTQAGADDTEKFQRRLSKLQDSTFDVAGQYPIGFACELRVPEWKDSMAEEARYMWGNAYIRLTRAGDRYDMRVEKLRDRSVEGFVNIALGAWRPAYAKEQEILAFFMPASIVALVTEHSASFDYREEVRDRMLKFGGKSTKPLAPIKEVEFIVDEHWALRALRLVFADGASYTGTYTHERVAGRDSAWIVTGADATVVNAKGITRQFKVTFDYQQAGKDRKYWVYKTVTREILDADGKRVLAGKNDPNPVTYEYEDYEITDPPKAADGPKPPVGDLWQLVR